MPHKGTHIRFIKIRLYTAPEKIDLLAEGKVMARILFVFVGEVREELHGPAGDFDMNVFTVAGDVSHQRREILVRDPADPPVHMVLKSGGFPVFSLRSFPDV